MLNDNYHKNSDENLKKRFISTCKFSNHDNNTYILLKFQETLLPEK